MTNIRKVSLIILIALSNLTLQQYVYTQLGENLNFNLSTPQLKTPIKLGEFFQATQQYTIWGWFRFDGSQPSITNILNIANYKSISNEDTVIGPFPNPNFPECSLTPEQLGTINNNDPRISQNPNCFPQKLDKKEIQTNLTTKELDVLYVNHDLNPPNEKGVVTYSITFLVQNGTQNDMKDMKIDGFVDIPFKKNSWSFFAISCDYVRGTANLFVKVFDGSTNNSKFKVMGLNSSSLILKNFSQMMVASVEKNAYFTSVTGFIGNIAYIEMSAFYTTSLETLWVGYLNSAGYGYKGVLIEFIFDIYNKGNDKIKSNGLYHNQYDIKGNYTPLFMLDKNKLGVRFNTNSLIELNEIDFLNNDLIKGFLFYFKLKFHNELPDEYIIVERGTPDQNGYIKISLMKNEDKRRFVRINVVGNKANVDSNFLYDSKINFTEGEIFYVMTGVVIAPSGAARVVYLDNTKEIVIPQITDNFDFNPAPLKIRLFDNKADDNLYNGYVDVFNFKILNSGTSVEFFNQIQKADEKSKFKFNDNCQLYASYYKNALGCFECLNEVLGPENNCVAFCPSSFKNPLNNICVDCLDDNCDEIDKTKWNVTQIDKTVFRLKPSRNLLSTNVDFENMVDIGFDKDYDYSVKKSVNNTSQYIDYDFEFKDTIFNEKLNFEVKNNPLNPQFDVNRNLLFHLDKSSKSSVLVNTIESNICYIKKTKKDAIKGIAIVLLIVFLISVVVLLFMSIICFKKFHNLGSLWKFLLHNWMKLQLIAFFVLLGIYMPCCIQEFLGFIYKYAVGWNHAFRLIIDDTLKNSEDFNQGMIDKKPPFQFYERYARSFILHNMTVFFIVQCFIFFIFLVLKIWDCAKNLAGSFVYKLFVFLEFTLLIVGYLVVHMHAFVFSSFNYKQAIFIHPYFVVCFLIAIAYILVFVVFWFYSIFRLLSSSNYLMNPINQNKFFYFYAGYNDTKFNRTFDHWMTLSHLVVGLMIGLLYSYPLIQIIIILISLLFFLGITILLRPWKSMIFNVAEIIMQFLIIVVVVMFLIIASYDKNGYCVTCKGREGAICWIAVILLFIAFLIGALALILETCRSAYSTHYSEQVSIASDYNYQQVRGMINEDNVSHYETKNLFNREEMNLNRVNNLNVTNVSNTKNLTMSEFMKNNEMKQDFDMSANYDNFNYDAKTNRLSPDSIDEEYIQPNIIRALSDNSFVSGLHESKAEIDHKSKYVQKKKMEFYENKFKSSSFHVDDHDNLNLDQVLHSRVDSGNKFPFNLN